jgi:MFS family permease
MNKKLGWVDFITINSYWLGINISSGIITPVLLPYLVVLFMPVEMKNTYLATVRVVGLAMAMLMQPVAGLLSDRCTHAWGRRRPFIFWGAILNVIFLAVIGASSSFLGSPADHFFQSLLGITTAYAVLLAGIVLLQFSSNLAHGALQGLIPDLVPEEQRGKASGVKAVFELLPIFLVIFVGALVDAGRIWLTIAIIMAGFIITMLVTQFFVHETPLKAKSREDVKEPILRLVGLTAIFVAVTQSAVWLVKNAGNWFITQSLELSQQVLLIGAVGLIAMAGSILLGVYFGAWVGIGREAPQQKSFIWWVVNRLLFLAAIGSIQGFAQYYLKDVLHVPNPATMTTLLSAVVGLFLIPSALLGGNLADKIGRRRLVAGSGLLATLGTLLLLLGGSIPMVLVSGSIIGLATGTFFASNWAMGTDLVPKQDAGRYLGISNLAGAGAGIVGAGIGGPLADFFNQIQPGLGYLVIFSIYGGLFLLSTLTLTQVRETK